jgi:major membrane immunogen (membrane-anchored lipoprotein)
MKKLLSILSIVIFLMSFSAIIINAATTYKDGVYSAKSEPDERGNYATIKITVKNGSITVCDWKELTKDGKVKDESYGKYPGVKEADYQKAQNALKATNTYGDKLVKVQEVDKVDAVSGATNSNKLFKELAKKALQNAKK